MKAVRTIAIIIVGVVFIFSGAVKAIDPLGSAYKFHDYFQAFGMGFLQFLSLPLSVMQNLIEFITGFAIITGFRRKEGTWAAFIMMLFFTPLTLVLALTNPVSDCGCFGDAVRLTNWQTFEKNAVLILLTMILFVTRNKETSSRKAAFQWRAIVAAASVFTLFEFYNLAYLPVIDFLPYSEGSSIPEKMKIPAGAAVTRYETTFIYSKDGVKKEFTLKDYPANDTTWKFIKQNSRILEKGFTPPIHDFSITTHGGRDITDSILKSDRPVLLMVSKKLEEASRKRLEKGFEEGLKLTSNGVTFLVLTSSGSDVVEKEKYSSIICSTDETTLKTMVRSNPGYLLIQKGIIKGKWSWADFSARKLSDLKLR